MTLLEYVSEGGYQYRQKNKSGRIARVRLDKPALSAVTDKPPKVGDKVKVIVKPYYERNYISGIVRRVLTKKKQHTRGFKVMLDSGVVGRMVTNL